MELWGLEESTLEKIRPDEQPLKGTAGKRADFGCTKISGRAQSRSVNTGDIKLGGSKMVCVVEPRLKQSCGQEDGMQETR